MTKGGGGLRDETRWGGGVLGKVEEGEGRKETKER
jgi:hypothetical protein